jgi:acyl-CoA synthetase (NDP forming)
MDRVFNPKAVAVIGDKQMMDFFWLNAFKDYTGRLYSVQVDPSEIAEIEKMGVQNYLSLGEVPEPVDYAVCAVPRHVSPYIVKDCIANKVGGVTLFTSGFAETGDKLGIELEAQIRALAQENGLLLIGPNCMGIHNPTLGVKFVPDQPAGVAGDVGFISQSGTHGVSFSLIGAEHGVYCSKLVSCGNALVLEVADYLDYMAADPATEVIGMYVEGVGDGRRFAQSLRSAAAEKPVIILKGGQTAAGSRATRSHTGSLATSQAIWDALVRQAGAVGVDSIDEMIDVVKAVRLTEPPASNRVALMAMTGGQSVMLTDAFAKAGLEVPLLSEPSYAEMSEFFNVIGGSFQNPLDMAGTIGGNPEHLGRLFDIIDRDPHVDAVAMEISVPFMLRRWNKKPEELSRMLDTLEQFKGRSRKPLITVLHPAHLEVEVAEVRRQLQARNIATFSTFERAAGALAKASSVRARRV